MTCKQLQAGTINRETRRFVDLGNGGVYRDKGGGGSPTATGLTSAGWNERVVVVMDEGWMLGLYLLRDHGGFIYIWRDCMSYSSSAYLLFFL